jgi:hypothetical protein
MTKKVVIQCAGSKNPDAGFWKHEGKKVKFVAQPKLCRDSDEFIYRSPDGFVANNNKTWRQALEEYNRPGENPFGLCKASELYRPKKPYEGIYKEFVEKYGEENVFILSAGWGLVRSDFLLPYYDITFAKQADPRKKRTNGDEYRDFNQLADNIEQGDTVYFFGGQDYLDLYYKLTWDFSCKKVIYHKAETPQGKDEAEKNGYEFRKYFTKQRNWHYPCARDFMGGKLV